MAWKTPKTNWVGTDTFGSGDWFRITYNTEHIANALSVPFNPFGNVSNTVTLLTYAHRNNITDTLDKLYEALGASWDRGYVAPRVAYGSTWNSRDLNIIESMLLNMKKQLDGEISGNVEYYADTEIYCGDDISVGLL